MPETTTDSTSPPCCRRSPTRSPEHRRAARARGRGAVRRVRPEHLQVDATYHFRVLREAGLIEQVEQGNRKLNTLRRDEIERRFPGLLEAVLGRVGPGWTSGEALLGRCLNAEMRLGENRACSPCAVSGRCGCCRLAARAPLARDFSAARPVNWISVAAGAALARLGRDGRRRVARAATAGAASARRSRRARSGKAQVAQATLLADGKTLLAMPTVWSAQQFTPPRWSSDGGATWHAGALAGTDAHYEFGSACPASSASLPSPPIRRMRARPGSARATSTSRTTPGAPGRWRRRA